MRPKSAHQEFLDSVRRDSSASLARRLVHCIRKLRQWTPHSRRDAAVLSRHVHIIRQELIARLKGN